MVGVVSAERTTAIAPPAGKDPTATLGIATMEFDEMAAALAYVNRMWISRGPAATAVRRVVWRPSEGNGHLDGNFASPRSAHHLRTMDRRRPIVDP
jgi:hypothetical protein